MDISRADFDFLIKKRDNDKDYHEKEFIRRIDPDLIDAYYEGTPGSKNGEYFDRPERITLNRIFPATSTLIAQFYPSNYKFIGIPRREEDELNARIASSAMDYYYEQMNAVEANQEAILCAWLYGIGITKQGWKSEFIKPETSNVSEKPLKAKFSQNTSLEQRETPEYIADSGPFIYSVNPKNFYMDKDKPYGKGIFWHERIPRTLWDIQNSDLYNKDIVKDLTTRLKRGGKDPREIDVDLYETYYWQKNCLYLLTSVKELHKPLRYEKLPYANEGSPYTLLTLNKQINKIYPVSNMKVAIRQQRFVDYVLTLQKTAIERHKNLSVFDGAAFEPDDRAKISRNEIGLNLFTKNGISPTTAATHIGGNTIPSELFGIQDMLTQNQKEILTIVGARQSGQSENKTLGQEQIAEFGNMLRSQGMIDSIREWTIKQGKKLLQHIKQFGTYPAMFEISDLNMLDPRTGQVVMNKFVEFATDRSPQTLKEIIPKDLDISVDVTSTVRRDLPVIRNQLTNVMQIISQPEVQQALLAQGERVKIGEIVKELLKTFETIDNPEKFFEKVSPIQEGLAQTQQTGAQVNLGADVEPEGISNQARMQQRIPGINGGVV